MGAIAALVVVIAGVFGAAHHDKVLTRGYDTTYRDTVAFEKKAAQDALERIREIEDRKGLNLPDYSVPEEMQEDEKIRELPEVS